MTPYEKNMRKKRKLLSIIVILLLIFSVGMSIFIFPSVSADEGGTKTFVGAVDAGDASTGISSGGGFFYYNDSGAWVITVGGYEGVGSTFVDEVERTSIDNTAGQTQNTSITLGALPDAFYTHCTVFDWQNQTIYTMGGFDGSVRLNTVYAFWLGNNSADQMGTLPDAYRDLSWMGAWYRETCWAFGGNVATEAQAGRLVAWCPGNSTSWVEFDMADHVAAFDVSHSSLGWDGTSDTFYFFGGYDGTNRAHEIVAYNFDNATVWIVGYLQDNRERQNLNVVYNDLNNTFLISSSTYPADNNITWWAPGNDTATTINNATYAYDTYMAWDNRSSNKTLYTFCGGKSGEAYPNTIYSYDFGEVAAETPSTSASLVLDNSKFTIQNELGTTSWANASGIYETGEFNITYYSESNNIDYIRINLSADLATNITNSNISMQFNVQNASWTGGLYTLNDSANIIWLNSSTWENDSCFIGTNPFPISSNTSIWWRLRVTIPSGIGTETYSQTAWTWDAGYYS